MRRIFIAGCGFLGETAARFFSASGWEVIALTSSAESSLALGARGIRAFAADLSSPSQICALADQISGIDLWLHCASSRGGGAPEYERIYVGGVKSLLAAFPSASGIFTSSTSVYSQTGGETVDELSPCQPTRETGRLLLDAERLTLESGGLVARLAGLFGPGRSAPLRKLLEGTATLDGDGMRWVNQIHRSDAASAIVHLANLPAQPGIYNVCDNSPLRQIDLFKYLSERLELPMPPSLPPDSGRKRGWSNKKVSNLKLRNTGWSPIFSDFFSALEFSRDEPRIQIRESLPNVHTTGARRPTDS